MQPAEKSAETGKILPWRPPAGGFDRQLKPSLRERRRRPLSRRQIAAIRVIYLLGATFCAVVWSLRMPASSSWRVEALAVAISLAGGLARFSRQQIRQLLGVRPPADRAR